MNCETSLEEHKKTHKAMGAAVQNLYDEITARATGLVPIKLNFFTSHWLAVHILKDDAAFVSYILGKKQNP